MLSMQLCVNLAYCTQYQNDEYSRNEMSEEKDYINPSSQPIVLLEW